MSLQRFNSGADVETVQLVRAGSGTLCQLAGENSSGADLYLHIFDSAVAPVDTDVPDWTPVKVVTGTPVAWSFAEGGIPFLNNIYVAWSTTRTELTLPLAGGWISATYT